MRRSPTWLAAAALALAACTEQGTIVPSVEQETRRRLALAEQIAASDPSVALPLRAGVSEWTRAGASFVAPRPGSRADFASGTILATAPTFADGWLTLQRGERADNRVAVRIAGLHASPGTYDEGRIVYLDVDDQIDQLVAATRGQIDVHLLLRGPGAPTTFDFELSLPPQLPTLRRHGDAFELVDVGGVPRYSIPLPFALDARGVRREADVTLIARGLRLHIDTAGLVFPVLLDPTLKSAAWSLRSPDPAPPERRQFCMAHDGKRTVIFGGFNGSSYLSDTWTWDGTSWTEITAAKRPSARLAECTNDALRSVVVLFGGYCEGCGAFFDDTWELGDSGWVQRPTVSPRPPRSNGHSVFFDEKKGAVLLFGERSFGPAGSTTWLLDGKGWSLPTIGGTTPPGRAFAPATYDAVRGLGVLFGGNDGTKDLRDTYVWNGESTTWARVDALEPPPAQSSARMAYDGLSRNAVLVGRDGRTFLFDGSEWTVLAGSSLGSRETPGLVYDPLRKTLVLFSGRDSTATGDTWEWRTLECGDDTDCATGHCVDGVCCKTACAGICPKGDCLGSDAGVPPSDGGEAGVEAPAGVSLYGCAHHAGGGANGSAVAILLGLLGIGRVGRRRAR